MCKLICTWTTIQLIYLISAVGFIKAENMAWNECSWRGDKKTMADPNWTSNSIYNLVWNMNEIYTLRFVDYRKLTLGPGRASHCFKRTEISCLPLSLPHRTRLVWPFSPFFCQLSSDCESLVDVPPVDEQLRDIVRSAAANSSEYSVTPSRENFFVA